MSLHDIAPRLARAHDQMLEVERVIGFLRDHGWTGGVDVFVPTGHYVSTQPYGWAAVTHVSPRDTASVYPIKGDVFIGARRPGIQGQWKLYEVAGIRWWSDDFPELADMHPEYPAPPERSPW